MPQPKHFALVIPQYKPGALPPTFGYIAFVGNVRHINKKQPAHVKREEVDEEWSQMVPKWVPLDLSRCQSLLAEASSSKADEHWSWMHHRAQQSIPASRLRTSGLIEEGLVLPKNLPQLTTQEHRYAKFVKQLQAENPDAKLTRDIVDAAAKGIIEKQISTKHNDRVSLLIRQVTGKESERYWAKRGTGE